MDFRVRGISNKKLYDYIRKFPKVGAGYYPNSTFVHMDVRKRKFLWTDISAPGEPSVYTKRIGADGRKLGPKKKRKKKTAPKKAVAKAKPAPKPVESSEEKTLTSGGILIRYQATTIRSSIRQGWEVRSPRLSRTKRI